MLKLIFCVCFFSIFCVINCHGHEIQHINVTITKKITENHQATYTCKIEKGIYNLAKGTTVEINIYSNTESSLTDSSFTHTITGNSSYTGFQKTTAIHTPGKYSINDGFTDYKLKFTFTWSSGREICSTEVHYEILSENEADQCRRDVIIAAVVGVIALIIIIATAIVFYYRSKFKALSRHNNLTRLKEEDESDADRYSTNPKKKDKKFTPIIPEDNRQSEIYEEPNVTIGASKHDVSNTSTLKMSPPVQNNSSYPTFPRPKHPIQDPLPKVSVADRPPLPLPDGEFYSEAIEEENLYEQPPILHPHQESQKMLPTVPKPYLQPTQQLPLPLKPIPQQKQFSTPQKQITTPQNQVLPPQKEFPILKKPLSTPQKQLPSPQKEFPIPQKQFPPQKQVASPQKQFKLPQKQEPTPQKQFPPAQKPFLAQKQVASPQKQEFAAQKQFPPPHKQEPSLGNSLNSTLKRSIQQQLADKLQLNAHASTSSSVDKPAKPPISHAKPTPPRNKNMQGAPQVSNTPVLNQVPIVQPGLKPPAPKPKTPPDTPSTLEQQVQFFNEHRNDLPPNSSDDDEDWTYEPLYNI